MQVSITSVEEIRPLRLKVLRPGCDKTSVIYSCDSDNTCFHVAAKNKKKVIGIATFYKCQHKEIKGVNTFRLRGMATDTDNQQKGIGKKVLKYAFKELIKKKVDILWCNARLIAVPFYEKIGFKIHGDIFEIKKIGAHYDMYIRL